MIDAVLRKVTLDKDISDKWSVGVQLLQFPESC